LDLTSWLSIIYFQRFRVYLRAMASGCLDGFAGGEIRGALGLRLKRSIGCRGQGNADCQRCPQDRKSSCPYELLFGHEGDAVKPMVMQLDPTARGEIFTFSRNETLRFDLLLVGSAAIAAATPILAGLEQGAMPLGSSRAPFELVEAGWVDGEGRFTPAIDGVLPQNDFRLSLPLFEERPETENGCIELVLHSPVEIQEKRTSKKRYYLREASRFSFELLTKRLLKRCHGLAGYCGWKPESDDAWSRFKNQLIHHARSVELIDWHAHWRQVNLRTHPGRKKGGLVGALVYRGAIGSFLPLLNAATVLGVGKNTTHGFGRMSYRLKPCHSEEESQPETL
jgi:hypothetical protein